MGLSDLEICAVFFWSLPYNNDELIRLKSSDTCTTWDGFFDRLILEGCIWTSGFSKENKVITNFEKGTWIEMNFTKGNGC